MCCQRHGGEDTEPHPLPARKRGGAECLNQDRDLRHRELKQKTDDTGKNHQWIVQKLSAKYGNTCVPHSHRMPELAHTQNRKGIGLGLGE